MKGFRIGSLDGDGEPEIRVFDLGTGEEVDEPGIAASAKLAFDRALGRAGVRVANNEEDPLEDALEIPDNIVELFPDMPTGQTDS